MKIHTKDYNENNVNRFRRQMYIMSGRRRWLSTKIKAKTAQLVKTTLERDTQKC